MRGRAEAHRQRMPLALPDTQSSHSAEASDDVQRLPLEDGECLLCAVLSDVAAVATESKRLERQAARHTEAVRRARAEGRALPATPDARPRVASRFAQPVTATVERLLADVQGDYRHTRIERRRRVARRLAALPELGLDVEAVERHHAYHRQAVIGGVGRATPARVELLEHGLRPRELAVLHMVARLGVTSVSQAAVLMGAVRAPADGKRGRPYERVGVPANEKLAAALLRRMTADELLVGLPLRFAPSARRDGQPPVARKAWVLTQRGVAVYRSVRDGERHDYRLKTLADPRAGVGARTLRHDLGVGDLLVALLAHTLREPVLSLQVGQGQRELQVSVSPENWWGAPHLLMAYTPPPRIEGERAAVSESRFIAPDAFCVIGVRGPAEDAALPLLVEHDTGIRSLHEVCDQLQAHAEFARSGALGARLPELAKAPTHVGPDGQRPAWAPVLFATRGPRRAANIAAAVAERERAVRYWQPGVTAARPPQYVAATPQLHVLGLSAPVLSLHAPERGELPLVRALLMDYRFWLVGDLPAAGSVLRLDRRGSHGVKGGNVGPAAVRRRADAERERMAGESQRAELAAIRERQAAREAERDELASTPGSWRGGSDA